jgi:murein DD-endopeptidase MepM/ murein hydrolase activator NlpD
MGIEQRGMAMEVQSRTVNRRNGTSGLPFAHRSVAIVAVLLSVIPSGAATDIRTIPAGGSAVSVRTVISNGYFELVVENHRLHDITLTLTITPDNGAVTRLKPETAVYPARSSVAAVRWSSASVAGLANATYRFNWVKGAMNAKHDDRIVYRLPFESGTSHRVIQGYDTVWSHTGSDCYAIDFEMPEGTSVCAARGGLVVDLWQSSEDSSTMEKEKPKANYVSILHEDRTIGEYYHLQHDGVLVKVGQRVAAGTLIARSGNTGHTTQPHLHFGVYAAVDGTHIQSHVVTFATRQGTVSEPITGRIYTAK